jgi:hypothetical protein
MGEKAATNEVINRLVSALGDKDWFVGRSACDALGAMGAKAEMSEVIDRVLSALQRFSVESMVDSEIILRNVLSLLSGATACLDKEFEPAAAVGPSKSYNQLLSVASHRLMKAYMDTDPSRWLPVVIFAVLRNGSAVSVIENTVWVYNREEIVKIPLTNQELLDKLRKAFLHM